ncbi:MAG: hypothetical protein Q8Q09_08190 [Deltaproteobacteria bacterium]|nr:hypothetical protein [Deltaproteobacteria bacterium]
MTIDRGWGARALSVFLVTAAVHGCAATARVQPRVNPATSPASETVTITAQPRVRMQRIVGSGAQGRVPTTWQPYLQEGVQWARRDGVAIGFIGMGQEYRSLSDAFGALRAGFLARGNTIVLGPATEATVGNRQALRSRSLGASLRVLDRFMWLIEGHPRAFLLSCGIERLASDVMPQACVESFAAAMTQPRTAPPPITHQQVTRGPLSTLIPSGWRRVPTEDEGVALDVYVEAPTNMAPTMVMLFEREPSTASLQAQATEAHQALQAHGSLGAPTLARFGGREGYLIQTRTERPAVSVSTEVMVVREPRSHVVSMCIMSESLAQSPAALECRAAMETITELPVTPQR